MSGASILLGGAFNPQIFQPSWFARQGLMSEAEADQAKIDIIHPQICLFHSEQFVVNVSQEKFSASTTLLGLPGPLRDLVNGTFVILEHTPIKNIGLNRQMHFAVESEKVWHEIGDALAPKGGWMKGLPGRVGLETLEISTTDPARERYKINTILQPSKRIHPGVFFEVNHQYVTAEDDPNPLSTCLANLKDNWEKSQDDAFTIASDVLHWAKSREPLSERNLTASSEPS